MAPGKDADRLSADVHGAQLLRFRLRPRIAGVVQAGQARRDLLPQMPKPLAIDLVICHSMAGCTLLHELCEDPRLVGGLPFVGHLIEDEVTHGTAPPEGDYSFLVNLPDIRGARKRYLLPAVQQLKIIKRMAAQLGIGRHGLGRGPAFPHDQLAFSYVYRLLLHKAPEGAGSAQHRRCRAIACNKLGNELCSLG